MSSNYLKIDIIFGNSTLQTGLSYDCLLPTCTQESRLTESRLTKFPD